MVLYLVGVGGYLVSCQLMSGSGIGLSMFCFYLLFTCDFDVFNGV